MRSNLCQEKGDKPKKIVLSSLHLELYFFPFHSVCKSPKMSNFTIKVKYTFEFFAPKIRFFDSLTQLAIQIEELLLCYFRRKNSNQTFFDEFSNTFIFSYYVIPNHPLTIPVLKLRKSQ